MTSAALAARIRRNPARVREGSQYARGLALWTWLYSLSAARWRYTEARLTPQRPGDPGRALTALPARPGSRQFVGVITGGRPPVRP